MTCVNSVRIYPETITLETGCWYYQAYAEVCPENADCKEVTWYSDDPAIASVNYSSGYIYARSVGVTRIHAMATDGSGCCDYLTVTVKKSVPVRSVTLDHSYLSLEKGTDVTLHATVCPENATNRRLNWHSNNPNVATVSNGGTVTAISKGSTIITATAADGSLACDCCNVIVTTDILVTSVNVVPSSKVMTVGNSAYLDASICPPDASNKCVIWHSENEAIATVSSNGLVIAHAAGTTVIYATSCDGSDITGCCRLTVNAKIPVSGITVTPATADLKVGARKKLTVTVSPANATDKRVRWSCGQSEIVLLDTLTGEIQAIAAGNATVTATAVDGSGVSGSCQVSVTEIPVTGISIDPTSYTMNAKSSARFGATISPSNATNKKIIWSSNNKAVATVNQNGCVTAVSPGNATIWVTAQGNKAKTASAALTVNAADTREEVVIQKNNEGGYKFFKATFKNGLIWESVEAERTVITDLAHKPHLRRANANVGREYSDQQLAFLYRLDPLGVEYYVNTYTRNKNLSTAQVLYYRDRIYKAIFGDSEDRQGRFRFTLDNNGNVLYGNYSGDRTKYYTNAEILFGSHVNIDWSQFWHDIIVMVFNKIPGVSALQLGVEVFRGLFFSGSLVGTANSAASNFLENYCNDYMAATSEESLCSMLLGWPGNLCSTLLKLGNIFVDAITPKNINDITLYKKIDEQSNYRLVFNGVPMANIIARCNT